MRADVLSQLAIAAAVVLALIIVAVVTVQACRDAAGGTDVESAMGELALTTYGLVAKSAEEGERCAICQSEFANADELVRVVPACGHFFHAECDVEKWFRSRGTCPVCRRRPWPPPPRLECPPMPPRRSSASVFP